MGILRAVIGSRRDRRVRERDRQRSRLAPLVEGLEGRALLSTLTVMNNGDSGPNSLCAMAGKAAAGDVIDFSPTLNGQTITLTGGEILLTPGVSIEGPGAGLLSISGNNSSRIFEVESAATDSNPTTSISGLSLLDGSALTGGAIDDAVGTGPLSVSNCYFAGNVAVVQGGAIASELPLSVYQCSFTDNSAGGSATGINGGDSGQAAYGGAIWSDSSLGVALSEFYYNDAVGTDGDGIDGFDADGGAIAWEPVDIVGLAGFDVQVSLTGNKFVHNAALGGDSIDGVHTGGNARGGAVLVDASLTEAMGVNVSNNMFTGNRATGGMGYYGGVAGGGSLVFDAFESYSAQFYANQNQFNGGGAYGGATDAEPETEYGHAGAAEGGAVAFNADAAESPTFTFSADEVTGTTAQGGSAGNNAYVYGAWANGGSSAGGGVYLDAATSSDAYFNIASAMISSDTAIGGQGGHGDYTGLAGGDASGGGFSAVASGASSATFVINNSQVNNCSASGGAGGAGPQVFAFNGASGGKGGNSEGGGISLDAGTGQGTVYDVTNDWLLSDTARGGNGGDGGDGPSGYDGGSGSNGGEAFGGGLALTEGSGATLQTTISKSKLFVDQAIGGNGGSGGAGDNGGKGGGGGAAFGGAVSLYGRSYKTTNQVNLDSDSLLASAAQAGSGGSGGVGNAGRGGAGGSGEQGSGGGLSVVLDGSVNLYSSIIYGNTAAGGDAADGGFGTAGFGSAGSGGVGFGGGIFDAALPGGTVNMTPDTIVIANNADVGPNTFGPIGTI